MAPLSLSQLLDVAIGTPEVGAVNFRALYSLLQATLRHLGCRTCLPWGEGTARPPSWGGASLPRHPPEKKGDRAEAQAQSRSPPRRTRCRGTVSTPQDASVAADMGQMKTKIEENKSSISKAVALSQDLLEETGGMKAAQSRMEEDIRMIQETLGML